jgi:hypothetical protein
MKSVMKKIAFVVLLLLLLPMALFGWAYANGWLNDDVDKEGVSLFHSPDGRFKLLVRRSASFWPMMPGDSSGAPGYVVLKDRHDRELAQAEVEMVQMVDQSTIYWSENEVYIKFVATWPLPQDP